MAGRSGSPENRWLHGEPAGPSVADPAVGDLGPVGLVAGRRRLDPRTRAGRPARCRIGRPGTAGRAEPGRESRGGGARSACRSAAFRTDKDCSRRGVSTVGRNGDWLRAGSEYPEENGVPRGACPHFCPGCERRCGRTGLFDPARGKPQPDLLLAVDTPVAGKLQRRTPQRPERGRAVQRRNGRRARSRSSGPCDGSWPISATTAVGTSTT